MATIHAQRVQRQIEYPTSDGKPMAETDTHRDDMMDSIETLRTRYAGQKVYVTGNILLYYVEGNPRKVISPDVWVARGVEPKQRDYYLLWLEPKPPEVAVEMTSKSTRREDTGKKFVLYRDVLKVKEYILFDPYDEYLQPRLQGYRLVKGDYDPIKLVDGRLPSKILGLHLEAQGTRLRYWDPATGEYLLNPREQAEAEREQRERAEQDKQRAEQDKQRADRIMPASKPPAVRRKPRSSGCGVSWGICGGDKGSKRNAGHAPCRRVWDGS